MIQNLITEIKKNGQRLVEEGKGNEEIDKNVAIKVMKSERKFGYRGSSRRRANVCPKLRSMGAWLYNCIPDLSCFGLVLDCTWHIPYLGI